MPRTKIQTEVEKMLPKYPDFNSLPNMITPVDLANSYFNMCRSTAQKLIESIPEHIKVGTKCMVTKKALGKRIGEL